MKVVYCANCGKELGVRLQAVPRLNTIVRVVEYHECSINDDFKFPENLSVTKEFIETEGKNEFVQKLNDLSPTPTPKDDIELKDKRFSEQLEKEDSKTTAPSGVQDLINLATSSDSSDEEEGNFSMDENPDTGKEEFPGSEE